MGASAKFKLARRRPSKSRLRQATCAIAIRGFFPDGEKLRNFADKDFRFVAEAPGAYRLDVNATKAGRYRLTLQEIQPLKDRLNLPVPEADHSPRIAALAKEIGVGHRDALAKFWEDVRREGTPLAEPITDQPNYLLVTFLWRETFETHNVLVVWMPYAGNHPDDYAMTRLAGTDLWYKTLRVRKGARFIYTLSPNDSLSRSPNGQRNATQQADPLNPRRRPADPNLTRYESQSVAELPGAPPQPWADRRPNVPEGKVEKHRFTSAILHNDRDISVYTPTGYTREGKAYPMAVLFDESAYLTLVPTPVILDNLIAERKIPPMVAVLIANPNQETRSKELPCNRDFSNALQSELIPWVHERYHVTRDPSETVIGGSSYGGLAAACAGLWHSETFGKILSQSGSYWWAPYRDPADAAHRDETQEPTWVARQFLNSSKLPLQFYMDAGTFENDIGGGGGAILEPSRHLRDVLLAKGYQVHYQENVGGHDYLSWRGSLADGLIALMGDK